MTTATNPAETYESYMVPQLFRPAAAELTRIANPRPGERVLDLACGTGVVARTVAQRVAPGGSVIGLDLNPGMLAVAKAAANREGLAIDWRQGKAEALDFPDASFDLVTCQAALMFFSDRAAAIREVARVLKPGGRAALLVWQGLDVHPFYAHLDDVMLRDFGTSAVAQIFSMGDPGELKELCTNAGLANVEVTSLSIPARFPDPDGFLAGEIAVDVAAVPSLQHLTPLDRERVVASLDAQLRPALQPYVHGDVVALDFHAHVAIARR